MNKNELEWGGSVAFGWFCVLIHDYPEPEGIVWFTNTPKPGERFTLPSSGYTQEWVVKQVYDEEMKFTAVRSEDYHENRP